MPPRINTILHSGFVLRQPPPHHIHASDFSQARWYPDQPRNFSALRRYVGRIRFFIHSRSQPNNYYSSCRFRTAHRKDHFRRLTLRAAARQEVTPMVQTARFELANPKILHIGAVSTQLLPAYCSLRAEPKPRPSGKEGGKEKEWRCRVRPAPPRYHIFFCCCISLCNIT